MQALFSNDKKFTTWRRLWIALAESEKELGLDITEEQIEELKAHALDINYDVAKAREKEVRHDVMSHVYAYGVQCPKAKGIIHLGATSCYVGDNTDLIIMHEALELVQKKIVNVLEKLEERLVGRYVVQDLKDPKTGELIVDTNTMISITEANQNFSKVARVVDEHGTAVILKNNVPRYLVIDFSKAEQEKIASTDDVFAISCLL